MSATNTQEASDDGRDPTHAPATTNMSLVIGQDSTGKYHHFHGPANAIVVYGIEEVDQLIPLEEKTLAQWYLAVNDERGWRWTVDDLQHHFYVESDAKRRAAQGGR